MVSCALGDAANNPDRPLSELAQHTSAPSAYVIGEGSLCLRCIEILQKRGIRVLGLISPDAENRRWAQTRGLPWHHPRNGRETILSQEPFGISSVLSTAISSGKTFLSCCAAATYFR